MVVAPSFIQQGVWVGRWTCPHIVSKAGKPPTPLPHTHIHTTWLGVLKRHASVLPNTGPEERVEMERRGRLSLVDLEQNNRIKETGLRGSQPCYPGHKLDQAISCCPWGMGRMGWGTTPRAAPDLSVKLTRLTPLPT